MVPAIIVFIIIYFGYIHNLARRVAVLEKQILDQSQTSSPVSVQTHVVEQVNNPSEVEVVTDSYVPQKPMPREVQSPTRIEDFGSILAKVGIAILVLGVGFFLNYINNKGLLSYNVKFLMGLMTGGALIGVAEYVKNRSLAYTQILRGGGFVVWFLSICVGSMVYNIFSIPVALTLTAGVVFVSCLVSLKEKTETTFLIGTLGAYVVPAIAGVYAQDSLTTVQVLWYMCVIHAGILFVSRYMDWIKVIAIGFVSNWIILFLSYGDFDALGWKVQLFFTTISALMFLVVFVFRDIQHDTQTKHTESSIMLTVLHTCIYMCVFYGIVRETVLVSYVGFFIALLGIVYFVVYMYMRKHIQEKRSTTLTYLVMSIVLITTAVPLQFDGALVTMIWFIEGIVLSYLATLQDFKGKMLMYVLGLGGIISGIIHMAVFGDYTGVHDGSRIFLNQQYLVWLFVIVLIHGIAYIWKMSVVQTPFLKVFDSFAKSVLQGSMFLILLGQLFFVGLTVYEIEGMKSFKIQEIYIEQNKQIDELQAYYGNEQGAYSYEKGNFSEVKNEEQYTKEQDIYQSTTNAADKIRKDFSFAHIVFFTFITILYLVIGLMRNSIVIRRLGTVSLIATILQLIVLAWDLGPIYRIAAFLGLGIVLLAISYVYIRHNAHKKGIGTTVMFILLAYASMLSLTGTVHAGIIDKHLWKYETTFDIQRTVPYDTSWFVVPIDSSVWSKSQKAGYGDIRIVNESYEEIPYIVLKQGASAHVQNPIQQHGPQVKIVENSLKGNKSGADRILVIDTGKEGQVYTGMYFERKLDAKNFRKSVRVYISDTLLGASSPAWREVEQKNTVYHYTDSVGFSAEDMDIGFPHMTSRYIKVVFSDDTILKEKGVTFTNQIHVTGVRMIYDAPDTTEGIQISNYISGNFVFDDNQDSAPSRTVLEADRVVENVEKKSTEIYINNLYAVTDITLDVDERSVNFNRDITVQGSTDGVVWKTVTTGQIYRIDSPIYTGESLTIETPIITYPYVRVIVQNNNDTSIRFNKNIITSSQKVGLLFKTDDQNIAALKLLIGNPHTITPSYEIEKTAGYFPKIVPTQVFLKPISSHDAYIPEDVRKPFGEEYRYLVNIGLIVFVLILGYLGYTWTRKA